MLSDLLCLMIANSFLKVRNKPSDVFKLTSVQCQMSFIQVGVVGLRFFPLLVLFTKMAHLVFRALCSCDSNAI